jgi:hypothetical protein
MSRATRPTLATLLTAMLLIAAFAAGGAHSAPVRACRPVINPYEGTRYDGIDLSRIRAIGVSCRTARRVARGAHRKALGLTPPTSGIRRFTWRGWRVTGDIRGRVDRYVARATGGKRVSWRF